MTGHVFRLPDLGEGLTEAEILSWRVEEGDPVTVDEVVVEVETAKAAVEVPCPYAGVVTALHGKAGDTLAVGAPLLTVDPSGRSRPAAPAAPAADQGGSGNVLVGYGTTDGSSRRRRRGRTAAGLAAVSPAAPSAVAPAVSSVPAPAVSSALGPAVSSVPGPAAGVAAAPKVISPLVRRLARDRGLDLTTLAGSGPGGIILRRDVEAASAAAATAHQPAPLTALTAAGAASVVRPAAPVGLPAEAERVPIRGVLRAMADKLSRSRREIPDASTWVDVDATGLLAARDALKAAYPDHRVGVLALLARIAVAGLRRFPQLNAVVDGDEIVRLPYVHLGFAAQTDHGLVVPVVKDAHELSTVDLADALVRLTAAARDGKLTPADLTGGTFTLNNYGVYGVDGSTPIINHPEAAMLGVGRIVDKPWVVDGQLAVRKVTQLSFTFDHRVCDGAVAGGFLRFVADCVENPYVLLGRV